MCREKEKSPLSIIEFDGGPPPENFAHAEFQKIKSDVNKSSFTANTAFGNYKAVKVPENPQDLTICAIYNTQTKKVEIRKTKTYRLKLSVEPNRVEEAPKDEWGRRRRLIEHLGTEKAKKMYKIALGNYQQSRAKTTADFAEGFSAWREKNKKEDKIEENMEENPNVYYMPKFDPKIANKYKIFDFSMLLPENYKRMVAVQEIKGRIKSGRKISAGKSIKSDDDENENEDEDEYEYKAKEKLGYPEVVVETMRSLHNKIERAISRQKLRKSRKSRKSVINAKKSRKSVIKSEKIAKIAKIVEKQKKAEDSEIAEEAKDSADKIKKEGVLIKTEAVPNDENQGDENSNEKEEIIKNDSEEENPYENLTLKSGAILTCIYLIRLYLKSKSKIIDITNTIECSFKTSQLIKKYFFGEKTKHLRIKEKMRKRILCHIAILSLMANDFKLSKCQVVALTRDLKMRSITQIERIFTTIGCQMSKRSQSNAKGDSMIFVELKFPMKRPSFGHQRFKGRR